MIDATNSGQLQTSAAYTDLAALNDIKQLGRDRNPESIRAVAREFESFFISQMIKNMRAGVDVIAQDNPLNSSAMQFHQQMFDQQMAQEMANQGGYGLADIMARQLSRQYELDWAQQDQAQELAALQRNESLFTPNAITSAPTAAPVALSRDNFVAELAPLAEQVATRLGVDKNVVLAQAALETGWGQHITGRGEMSSNNLFNIKADARWEGPSVRVSTLEYRQGVAVREQASFRAYGDFQQSFEDYAKFLESNPRYGQALANGSDPQEFIRELQAAGYATDPNYADKILSIMQRIATDQ
jgi:flagellar protein FlgJ